jgi:hypothetical protein
MNRKNARYSCSALALIGGVAALLSGASPAAAQGSGKSVASSISVYVVPQAGQDASQQSKDEADCYSWATKNTGTDPVQISKQAQATAQQGQAAAQTAGEGAGVRGAAKGAAAGAMFGAIGGDAGTGAAVGAAAGAIAGRRQKKQAQAQTAEQAQSQASSNAAAQMDNFKKAFSVCLEGKKYLVKY